MSQQAAEHHHKAAQHHDHAARHHREAARHPGTTKPAITNRRPITRTPRRAISITQLTMRQKRPSCTPNNTDIKPRQHMLNR